MIGLNAAHLFVCVCDANTMAFQIMWRVACLQKVINFKMLRTAATVTVTEDFYNTPQ